MSTCIYCGKSAGFFRKKHANCEKIHLLGINEYVKLVNEAINTQQTESDIETQLNEIVESSFITAEQRTRLLCKAFENSIDQFLEDGILSISEEKKLLMFMEGFGLSQTELDKNGYYSKTILASILRDLSEGKIPEQRINIGGVLPFLLQKSETLLWIFKNVDFYESTIKTEYQGGSSGMSIRIAKGLYYRTSAFKGRPVRSEQMTYKGTGLLAITTKHLYFDGSPKKFKIPFSKLLSIEPFEDGIGLQKDGVTAKPQVFKNLDGWFIYNVIINLKNNN